MRILLFILFIAQPSFATTKLLMIGGGARPEIALKTFVESAGREQARIVVSPWASESTEGAEAIKNELNAFHPASVQVLPAFPISESQQQSLIHDLLNATGIFFAGGDQNRLMMILDQLQLIDFLKSAYHSGVILGGTSAGTAIMSDRMISGDSLPLAKGLGLLPSEIVVDQHFLVRQRFQRLASVVLENPNTVGLGIDEGTSLFVINNRIARVLGPSQVVLFSKESTRKISVEYYHPNEQFNLFHLKSGCH